MKKILFILPFILVFCLAKAQRPFEVGYMAGVTLYHGDLGRFYETGIRPGTGFYGRYNFSYPVSCRINLLYARAGSWDHENPSSNLSFRSYLFEYSAQLEFYITKPKSGYKNYSLKYGKKTYYAYHFPLTSYFFIGIGQCHFNPRAKYLDGKWYSLQKLSTEGQGVFVTRDPPYPLVTPVIPVGVGGKWTLNGPYYIGFELGFRKTFTDYLDDVSLSYVNTTVLESAKGPVAAYFADPSQNPGLTTTSPAMARGNPKNKDAYMFAFVTLQYDFSKKKKKKSFRI